MVFLHFNPINFRLLISGTGIAPLLHDDKVRQVKVYILQTQLNSNEEKDAMAIEKSNGTMIELFLSFCGSGCTKCDSLYPFSLW